MIGYLRTFTELVLGYWIRTIVLGVMINQKRLHMSCEIALLQWKFVLNSFRSPSYNGFPIFHYMSGSRKTCKIRHVFVPLPPSIGNWSSLQWRGIFRRDKMKPFLMLFPSPHIESCDRPSHMQWICKFFFNRSSPIMLILSMVLGVSHLKLNVDGGFRDAHDTYGGFA